jgi:hypothetical protein
MSDEIQGDEQPINPMTRDGALGGKAFTVTFDQSSFVNTKTGEVNNPAELLTALRDIEKEIQAIDLTIEEKQGELKLLKERRSGCVRDILDRVRSSEVQTLPLFDESNQQDAQPVQ